MSNILKFIPEASNNEIYSKDELSLMDSFKSFNEKIFKDYDKLKTELVEVQR